MNEHLHTSVLAAHWTLVVMAIVYSIRIFWFTRFKAGKERQASTGTPGRTNPIKGRWYSWFIIAMPWAMESSRKKPLLYGQFVLFHIGVVAAIAQTFTLPFLSNLHTNPIGMRVFQVMIGLAFLVAVIRIIRRISSKYLRAISTPDDHFSLLILTVWFFFGLLSANYPLDGRTILIGMDGNLAMMVFFWMTAFFLIYVPFSKISHYLYYPFTRYYLGKTMGHRGVYPLVRKQN